MAARKEWRFYVYELRDGFGKCAYIGKGSGNRLAVQRRNMEMEGDEVARFKREVDAYAYEVARIAESQPYLNKCAGGNGSKATPKRTPRKTAWEKEVEAIGTRAYSARLLLMFGLNHIDPSKVDNIRRIAYG